MSLGNWLMGIGVGIFGAGAYNKFQQISHMDDGDDEYRGKIWAEQANKNIMDLQDKYDHRLMTKGAVWRWLLDLYRTEEEAEMIMKYIKF